jgi:thiazole tautomerase (transcriptional regulator TenI)
MQIPQLHLISSREVCPIDRLPDVARAAVDGGVDAVHLREPWLDDAELESLAQQTRQALNGSDARLLINSNVAVAVAALADGVHFPERHADMVGAARALFSYDVLIGVSIHSPESAVEAQKSGADYVIAGHVFETASKSGQAGRGISFVESVCSAVSIPVIAIGGMTPENTGSVLRAGAYGIAVLSGILAAEDPHSMARQFAASISEVQVGR